MKNFFLAIGLALVLSGCDSDEPQYQPISQKTFDGIVLQLMVAQMNSEQTNWTVVIVPRTNDIHNPL